MSANPATAPPTAAALQQQQQPSNSVPGQANQQSQNDGKSSECCQSEVSDHMIDSSSFEALQNIDLNQLASTDVIKVLPFLTKLLFSPTFIKKQQLFKLLYPIQRVNDVIQLMLTRGLEMADTVSTPPTTAFESCDPFDRMRIVAVEYMRIQDQTRQASFSTNPILKFIESDLLDQNIYVDYISYCLYILLIKSASIPVINILDMTEALLHVRHGAIYIIRLLENMPERCQEVCHTLITFGEKQDEGANFNEVSEQRAKLLRMLCIMNPTMALTIRATTLQLCKMPSLTVMITLDCLKNTFSKYKAESEENDDSMDDDPPKAIAASIDELEDSYDSAVAFITGILLGVDEVTSTWFSQYTKVAQQKRIDQLYPSVLTQFRSQIVQYMTHLFPMFLENDYQSTDSAEGRRSNNRVFKSDKELNRKLIRATATLRLFCALRGIGSLKLNPEESEMLLRLITCRTKVNQTSINFATTGVCTLLVCSALINNQKEEKRAAEWLKWLIKESNYSDTRYSSHGKCSISELLLLIAIHFQNNQNTQIADLVCATLGMKLQIKASVSKCKSLFVQEVFNDQMVAEHAVRVPVTKNLDNNIVEFLPVHCVHQLLESRSFSKHQVPIKDWIYKQICESKKPLHNMLQKLIEAYVNSVIVSTSVHGHCGTNQPLSEEDITRVFKTRLYSVERTQNINSPEKKRSTKKSNTANQSNGDSKDNPEIVDLEAAQVLLLYYLLLYDEIRLRKNSELSVNERTNLLKYSPDFMMEIPIFYLLQVVRNNQDAYGSILPDLLKLVSSQYPQLCSIHHWLTTDHYEPYHPKTCETAVTEARMMSKIDAALVGSSKSTKNVKENFTKQLEDGFKHLDDDPLILVKAMENILILPKEEIWPHVETFIFNLHRIVYLDSGSSQDHKKLIRITTKLWWKFNTIFPRKLWVMTVNAIKRPSSPRGLSDIKPLENSWDEIALDPLIVLRCDMRVYRCAEFLSILLHILNSFLAASKRCLQDQIHEQPGRQKDFRNLEELRTTLILAQTSAAIQILLESCIPSEEESEAINKQETGQGLSAQETLLLERFNSSVDCICEHLHQVFIADTNLAKLVHFQTYPSQLLPTTSDKIPSMHICLDFIPELLSQPDLSKQVFVIELASHLCEKYAITKSLDVAKLCFNVAYTLLQLLPSERRALFYVPVLPALLRICKVFPILREDADIILSQINQITLAHMASTSSRLSLGTAKPFEGLERMSWRDAKKLMDDLGIHEALYLCIQKCSLDLKATNEAVSYWTPQQMNQHHHFQPLQL